MPALRQLRESHLSNVEREDSSLPLIHLLLIRIARFAEHLVGFAVLVSGVAIQTDATITAINRNEIEKDWTERGRQTGTRC